MSRLAIVVSLGLALGGVPGALLGSLAVLAWRKRSSAEEPPPSSQLVMMLLLVELGSGSSVLAALVRASERLPEHAELRTVARVATVAGLTVSISRAGPQLRPLVAQLARAQHSGAPLAPAVRRLLEQEVAAERSRRIARARALPVRLMIPVTLLMLPGVVLLLYAPALMSTFEQLTGVWS